MEFPWSAALAFAWSLLAVCPPLIAEEKVLPQGWNYSASMRAVVAKDAASDDIDGERRIGSPNIGVDEMQAEREKRR